MIKGLTSGWCPGNVLGSDHPWLVARFQRWIVLNYFYFDIFGYFVVLGFQRFNQYQWGKIYGHQLRSLGWWKTGPIPGVPGCDLEPEECYWELAQNADGKSVLIHLQNTLGTAWPRRRVWKGNWAQEFRLRSWVGPFNIGGGLLAFFPAPFDRESWFARFCSFSVLAPAIPFLCNSYRPTSPYYWPRHAHTHFFHMKVEKRWTEINRDEKRWKEMKRVYTNLLKWLRTGNTSFQGTLDLLHVRVSMAMLVWYGLILNPSVWCVAAKEGLCDSTMAAELVQGRLIGVALQLYPCSL